MDATPNEPAPQRCRSAISRAMALVAAIGWWVIAATACVWEPDRLAALTLFPPAMWSLGGLAAPLIVWRRRKVAIVLFLMWFIFSIRYVEELRQPWRWGKGLVTRRPTSVSRPLRIVSLNCANTSLCLADLQRASPDIALLQEPPGDEQLSQLARGLFGGEGEFLAGGDTAILARGRIRQVFLDRSAPFVSCHVELGDGRVVRCISLRLVPPPSRLDFWEKEFWDDHRKLRIDHRQQLQSMMSKTVAAKLSVPTMIAGDFNTTPLDPALNELRPQFSDTFVAAGCGWGATGTNDWPLFRVDQIRADSQISPKSVRAEKTQSSDHRIVIAEFDLAGR